MRYSIQVYRTIPRSRFILAMRYGRGTSNNSITPAGLILQDMFPPALETEVWPRTPESEGEGSAATL